MHNVLYLVGIFWQFPSCLDLLSRKHLLSRHYYLKTSDTIKIKVSCHGTHGRCETLKIILYFIGVFDILRVCGYMRFPRFVCFLRMRLLRALRTSWDLRTCACCCERYALLVMVTLPRWQTISLVTLDFSRQ